MKKSKPSKSSPNSFTIKIVKTKNVKMVKLDLEMSPEAEKMLLKFARKNILDDREFLLSWAFEKACTNYIEQEKKNDSK